MQLSEYQALAQRTARDDHPARALVAVAGLAGEAGEVAELLKKHHGHGHDLDVGKLAKELGDVLWYLAELAACHGLDLDAIAEANILKLKARYPDGFSSAASVARVDVEQPPPTDEVQVLEWDKTSDGWRMIASRGGRKACVVAGIGGQRGEFWTIQIVIHLQLKDGDPWIWRSSDDYKSISIAEALLKDACMQAATPWLPAAGGAE